MLAPPSRYGADGVARWLRGPDEHPLPDGLRLLEFLADACEGAARATIPAATVSGATST